MARSHLAPTRLASRTVSAFWLDASLLVLLLLIQSPRLTGVLAHETLGLAIVVPLVLHLLLSWHWIIAKGKRLGAGASWRSRFNYALNAALFVPAVVTIISGVLDSVDRPASPSRPPAPVRRRGRTPAAERHARRPGER